LVKRCKKVKVILGPITTARARPATTNGGRARHEDGLNRRRLGIALLIGVVSEIVNKIAPLLTIRHAQQALGLASFGAAQYIMYLIDIFLPWVAFGYYLKGAHDYQAADQSERRQIVGRLTLVRLFHATAAYLLLYIWLKTIDPQYLTNTMLLGTLLFVSAFDMSFALMATQKLWQLSVLQVVTKLLSYLCVVLAVKNPEHELRYLVFTFGFNSWIPIWTTITLWREGGWALPTFSGAWKTFVVAVPVGIVTILSGVFDRFDLALIEANLDATNVGLYSGVVRAYQSLLPLMMTMVLIFYSEVIASADKTRLVRKAFELIAFLGVPVAAGAWFVGEDLLALLIGTPFAQMATVFSWFMLSFLLHGLLFAAVLLGLLAQQRHTAAIDVFAISGALALTLCYGALQVANDNAVTKMSYVAIATVVAKGVGVLLALYWTGWLGTATKALSKVLLATALMTGFLYGAESKLFWAMQLIVGGSIYVGIMLYFQRQLVMEVLARVRRKPA
jgi:O-antigen/teichoic acid export membrane protein